MDDNLGRISFAVIGIVGVVVLAALGVQLIEKAPPAELFVISAENGIEITPPGSEASAHATVDGNSFGWFLWEFDAGGIKPGEYDTTDDGKTISFPVRSGATYAISLLVVQDDGLRTYQRVWKPAGPPPPDDPDLEGFAKLAYEWAAEMSAPARAQAVRVGANFRTVGVKLAAGGYTGADWVDQTQAALTDLAKLNGTLHADWDEWEKKWGAEMDRRLDSGEIKETVASVGASFIEVGSGLAEVKESRHVIYSETRSKRILFSTHGIGGR